MNILNFLKNFRRDMSVKKYSESTISNYTSQVGLYLNFFSYKKEPKAITTDEIKDWLLTSSCINSQRHAHSALKCFYDLTINQPRKMKHIPYAKKEKSLPQIIDKDHIINSISNITNLKHKAIITLAYSTGMRV